MNSTSGADPADAVRVWRGLADTCVLLDGFHAIKHALRFGARVPAALTSDRAGVLALADELAPDVRQALEALLAPVDDERLRALVPRLHPTAVAALAERPSRDGNLEALGRLPRAAPVIVLDDPRNLGNAGAVIRLAAGFGATGVVTTGTLDPWHPTVVRGGAGLHFATAVERMEVAALPPGPVFALDAEGEDIRGLKLPDDAVLAFGSERSGLSAALRERADHLVSLPMRPQVSSYNLATSVGMTLFHWSAGSPPGAGGPPGPQA
ncbi:TrmH family RNA methyltransferase [Streptomyces alfalfae]|uniref:TrmH family RNA methyltransferase n=1 Tax=Streptomyces alfalfae TaxID=1642299 RepID=A0A1P8TI93_9ACTN|nr:MULTISPECIES: TrmH family RNA methyltransferase [Streptomyces]AYA17729.1 TrmH family RNA methyltransferase [Streptomyces fradiae]APY87321.1 rRNA methyltransferase [Streptomyces alfalfae]KUL54953.1 rRNA methyltransferase [Streptomyces sp. NRRL S-1521]QQC90380.1 TrmH family RNA methyltransferase [Streptomyces alfalfae]QUI32853.1 TrmH family RNA methyltransferase [Streptomyces alfalfae]